ncbi:kexin [Malassezia cuniculi]|uniref:Kexin n=1 Tax=Malassezia cuniculi TaxID=948313 RepID=A0AAF0J7J6_9BASI|nr:kexin [Malassezia cuniculi]
MLAGRIGALLALVLGAYAAQPKPRAYDTHRYYAIGLRSVPGCDVSPELAADVLGTEFVERVGELHDHWLVRREHSELEGRAGDAVLERYAALKERPSLAKRCVGTDCATERCVAESLASIDKQVLRKRAKRDVIYDPETMPDIYPRILPPVGPQERAPVPHVTSGNRSDEYVTRYHLQDPLFYKQWHLVNQDGVHDLNMERVWDNATGRGIHVALIDDGIDYKHPDLAANFFAEGSYDFNDHTALPDPRLSDDRHGTRCAGEIAAVRNDRCGVGVAPDAKVAGIRILSAPISDVDEAAALNYKFEQNEIYSCSWGPPDDGMSMDGPRGLVLKSLLNGINKGRGGKGNLFVFAGGNGGKSDDQCNFDGYTNSIYTMTIASVDGGGRHPSYSEVCTAIIASSWSSGNGEGIYTTDVTARSKTGCTGTHGGTSAAAPLIAALMALALEKRPELTWRDVQHLTIAAAKPVSEEDPDWFTNSAGRRYNHKFGYGVVDASLFMTMVAQHQLVPPQAWLDTPKNDQKSGSTRFNRKTSRQSKLTISDKMLQDANLASLEHVTVDVWIDSDRRGDVQVELVSPHGMRSILARPRRYDSATTGFPGWTFMSIAHWGEDPRGEWTLNVSSHTQNETSGGEFHAWAMHLWGAAIDPAKARQWTFPQGSLEYNLTMEEAAAASTSAGATSSATSTAALTTASVAPVITAVPTHAAVEEAPPADTGSLRDLWDRTPIWALVAAGVALAATAVLAAYFVFRRDSSQGMYHHVPDEERDGHALHTLQARDLYNAFALDETHVLGSDEDDDDDDGDGDDEHNHGRGRDRDRDHSRGHGRGHGVTGDSEFSDGVGKFKDDDGEFKDEDGEFKDDVGGVTDSTEACATNVLLEPVEPDAILIDGVDVEEAGKSNVDTK